MSPITSSPHSALENSRGKSIASSAQSFQNFCDWFGDSKALDFRGRPLVMYHGTATNFARFDPFADPVNDTGYMGAGVYFTTFSDDASNYATMASDILHPDQGECDVPSDAHVIPVYLSIRNPYQLHKKDPGTLDMDRDEVLAWTASLKLEGYDGVVNAAGNEWVAFYPEQIKSAIGNPGTYNKKDQHLTDGREVELGQLAELSKQLTINQAKRHNLKC